MDPENFLRQKKAIYLVVLGREDVGKKEGMGRDGEGWEIYHYTLTGRSVTNFGLSYVYCDIWSALGLWYGAAMGVLMSDSSRLVDVWAWASRSANV